MAIHQQNRVLGRGKVYFDRFDANGNPTGERYIGNTPGFTLSMSAEVLDHRSSDSAVSEIDDSATLSVDRTFNLTTDNVDRDNLALMILGSAALVADSGETVSDEKIDGVQQGLYYQLGTSDTHPTGVRALDVHTAGPPAKNIIVTDDAVSPNTFDEGADYEVDMALGRIYVVPGGNIADGTNLRVSYKTKASTRDQVISGNTPIEGALRYIADNAKGVNRDLFIPWARLVPNGDTDLKSNEWSQISYTGTILKRADREAVYIDGRAVTA